ncbi:DNA-binding transcription factor Pho7 [Schizosaccharomyces osmophilus]|uniref:DNA-binding transcription factor Pho7 n=1 Tax=Schizosaccharomyces osmophilus TaxID=2545709 RepID=A0AAF0AW07_9SCHI|nr:DNA-binding transcription factor Pho7 [Schizosaccharomyces osmophilus]WBW72469.1 DNA-binding transcription factor Pho7 [Schizosaccharomyces osmophilus]
MENNSYPDKFRFLESQNSPERSDPLHNPLGRNDFDEQFYWVNQHMRHLWSHSNPPTSASGTTSTTDTPYGTFQHSFHPLNHTISNDSIAKNPVSPHLNHLPHRAGILGSIPTSEPQRLSGIASVHQTNDHSMNTLDPLTYMEGPSFAQNNIHVEHSNHPSMFPCPPSANNIMNEPLENVNSVPPFEQPMDQSLLRDGTPLYRVCSAPDPPTVSKKPSVKSSSIENQSSSTSNASPEFRSSKTSSASSNMGAFEKVKEKLGEVKKKRQQTKHACAKCQRDNKKCDESRPCIRCRKTECEDQCIDIPRKKRPVGMKRGPYKKGSNLTASTRRSDQERFALSQKKKSNRMEDPLVIKPSEKIPSNNESSLANTSQDVPFLESNEESDWPRSRVRSYTNPVGSAESMHYNLPEALPLYPQDSPSITESSPSKMEVEYPELSIPPDFSAYTMHTFPPQPVNPTVPRPDEYVAPPWPVHDPSIVPPHLVPQVEYEHPPEVKMEDENQSVRESSQTGNDPMHPSYHHMSYGTSHIPEAEPYANTHSMFDGMNHLDHAVSNDSSYSPHDTNFTSPFKSEEQTALPETHYPFLRGRIHSFSIAADSPHHLVERPCLHCLGVTDNPDEHANLADLRDRQQRELEFTSMLLFHDHPSYHARPDLNFHEVLHPEQFAYRNLHHDHGDNCDY